jgi:hypothetical protein
MGLQSILVQKADWKSLKTEKCNQPAPKKVDWKTRFSEKSNQNLASEAQRQA